jgi:hypothetical protein
VVDRLQEGEFEMSIGWASRRSESVVKVMLEDLS